MKYGMNRGVDTNSSPLPLGLQLYTSLLYREGSADANIVLRLPTATGWETVLTLSLHPVCWAQRTSAAAIGVANPTATGESYLPSYHPSRDLPQSLKKTNRSFLSDLLFSL